MEQLRYPDHISEKQLYDSIKDVLNRRGYRDHKDSEALYKSNEVTVELEEGQLLKIKGPSSSEETIISNLLEPELE